MAEDDDSFAAVERRRSAMWKASAGCLPDAARRAAPYVGKDGHPGERDLPFCLPAEFASLNLLPEVRDDAMALFETLGIPWHAGIDGGPSNHLLSSQVQCVNALGQMVEQPARIVAAFGELLEIAEVLEIEPDRCLTFEYIGASDYFDEGAGAPRTRGSHCTSVDAAFRYRGHDGGVHLALIEWKYTESYRRMRQPDPERDSTRRNRYLADLQSQDGPLRAEVWPFELFLDEPFYQLMRQQLMAHRLEQDPDVDVDTVQVVHVLSPRNLDYQRSLVREGHRTLGQTVSDVWALLLRRPSTFVHLDPVTFLRPEITSDEYCARYG